MKSVNKSYSSFIENYRLQCRVIWVFERYEIWLNICVDSSANRKLIQKTKVKQYSYRMISITYVSLRVHLKILMHNWSFLSFVCMTYISDMMLITRKDVYMQYIIFALYICIYVLGLLIILTRRTWWKLTIL